MGGKVIVKDLKTGAETKLKNEAALEAEMFKLAKDGRKFRLELKGNHAILDLIEG